MRRLVKNKWEDKEQKDFINPVLTIFIFYLYYLFEKQYQHAQNFKLARLHAAMNKYI